jgi:hypothetical protein
MRSTSSGGSLEIVCRLLEIAPAVAIAFVNTNYVLESMRSVLPTETNQLNAPTSSSPLLFLPSVPDTSYRVAFSQLLLFYLLRATRR